MARRRLPAILSATAIGCGLLLSLGTAHALAASIGRSASLARPTAKIPPLVAYSDAQSVLPMIDPSTAISGLPACGSGTQKEPSFAHALADAKRLFKGRAAQGLKNLEAYKYSGTPGRADVFATTAVLARAPAAGLAALLDAERRTPRNPMLLVNASVFLTELGHPADALAFLDRARKLGRVKGAPLGLDPSAVELNDRGFALLGMHRYADALTSLRAAVRAGGRALSEASINEAQALKCTGRPVQALHALLAGAYRENYDLVDEPTDPPGPNDQEQPSAGQLGFTRPTGPPDKLPTLSFPKNIRQTPAADKGYIKLGAYLTKLTLALVHQTQNLDQLLIGQLRKHASPLTFRRTSAILGLIFESGNPREPALKKAFGEETAAFNALGDYLSQFTGQAPPSPCPTFAQGRQLVLALYSAIGKLGVALSRYYAPLAASLSNPLAHELAIEDIRAVYVGWEEIMVGSAQQWSGLYPACVSNELRFPAPGKRVPQIGDPGNCHPEVFGFEQKWVVKLPFADLKVNCESVEVEISAEDPVTPFISVEHTVHGETTIFGGAKVGTEIGPFGAELQEGFYIKAGQHGLEDWGFRVAGSATAGGDHALVEYGSSVDISLAGSIDYIPTAFGFGD